MSPKPEFSYDREDLIRALPTKDQSLINILLLVNTRLGSDNEWWTISLDEFCEKTKLSKRTVQLKISFLDELGILLVKKQRDDHGRKTSSAFGIDWAKHGEYVSMGVPVESRRNQAQPGAIAHGDQAQLATFDSATGAQKSAPVAPCPYSGIKHQLNTNKNTNSIAPGEIAHGEEAAAPPEQEKVPQLSNPAEKFDPHFYAGETGEIMKFMVEVFSKAFPEIGAVPGFGSGRKADLTKIVAEFGATDVKDTWRWMCTAHHDRARFCQKTPAAIIGYLLNKPQDYIELMRADNNWYAEDLWAKKVQEMTDNFANGQIENAKVAAQLAEEEADIKRRKEAGDPTAKFTWEVMGEYVAKRKAEAAAERKAEVERKRKSRLESMKAWEEITGQPAVLKIPRPPSTRTDEERLERLKRLLAERQTNAS